MNRKFRILSTWCCKHKFEWLGEELPNFCPACGWAFNPNRIVDTLFSTVLSDSNFALVMETIASEDYYGTRTTNL